MLEYQYVGINQIGKKVKGSLLAFNLEQAEQKLQSQKFTLISLKAKKPGLVIFNFKQLKPDELIHFTFQLEQLIKAGIPLMDALKDLINIIENKYLQKVLQNIYAQMEDGVNFSQALKLYPQVFNEIYISLIQVGEQTGSLDLVLTELLQMLTWEAKLISKIKKLMIYPSILLALVVMVVVLMMLFVVPELIGFISEMGGELGFATKSLIFTSNFIQQYGLLILISSLVLLVLIKFLTKVSYSLRINLAKFKLNLWLLGKISYEIKLARFARSLAIMHKSGISITESLPIATQLLNNEYLEAKFELVNQLIQQGYSIKDSFEQVQALTELAIRMIRVGEQTGRLDEALFNLSNYYDLQTNQKIDKLEPAIEPLLTLIMGLIVGWIMLAVLGPVYGLISELNI